MGSTCHTTLIHYKIKYMDWKYKHENIINSITQMYWSYWKKKSQEVIKIAKKLIVYWFKMQWNMNSIFKSSLMVFDRLNFLKYIIFKCLFKEDEDLKTKMFFH